MIRLFAFVAAVVLCAAPATAQTRPAPMAQRPQTFDWRAYVLFDSNAMAASKTFDAVFGTSTLTATGFGGEVLHIWQGFFARVAVSSMEETGNRVVVSDNEAVSLGIPLRLKMRPVEIGAGWRLKPVVKGRLVPYVGAATLRVKYTESSDFANDDENTAESFVGTSVFAGVEARVAPWIIAGVEAQYRSVPDAFGTGGVSGAFKESNLGGTTLRVLVGIRR